jgi:oligopeptide transport system substrate-binding protein
VLELMGDYIIGLKDLHALLVAGEKASKEKQGWIDLRNYPMSGVEVVDRYTYRVRIKGAYPQFPYWLAMPFLCASALRSWTAFSPSPAWPSAT